MPIEPDCWDAGHGARETLALGPGTAAWRDNRVTLLV